MAANVPTTVVDISSPDQFSGLLKSSKVVVTFFTSDSLTGLLRTQVHAIFTQLSGLHSRPNRITFVKVHIGIQKEIGAKYAITTIPTFTVFKDGNKVEEVKGTDLNVLKGIMTKLAEEADMGGKYEEANWWRTAPLPRGYGDVSDQVDVKGLELLNFVTELGWVRVLLIKDKPAGLYPEGDAKSRLGYDWVESDTDEQLMIYMPFQATLKIHTLQITSLPPVANEDDDEVPMRPKTIKLYTNRPHILGFDEADDIPATQTLEISPTDWDSTGTATIPLRFVKFQNVTSLVLYIVDGDGGGERTRIDRVRFIGETGEKRELGKLEKIGDEQGE